MDYLEKFNQTFVELMDDLQGTFPHDPDFQLYGIGLRAAVLAGPQIVQDKFHRRICLPFGDKILAKDEAFFLENTFEDVQQEFSEAARMILKVKQYWADLSAADREMLWKYFQVLVRLDRKIAASAGA